jgi:flagellar biosynthesis protein FlhA
VDIVNQINTFIRKYTDVITASLILGIIVIIILPVPTFFIDLLLSLNITIALMILLLTVFSQNVLNFSAFPSMLLITTLFRLALNVSTTRSILSNADGGNVIEAFGSLVTGNNYIVGAIIFVIIVIVQFVVITNGAGRVAEVAARFTLDAMPGKQMSIDADLSAGLITEQEAKDRRKSLAAEAEFYGAMDGANKFVKGDAIAGIVITIINFLGGILIGLTMHSMGAGEAAETFGKLTIGDGLVSQVPALLISVSSGILITRASTEQNLGTDIATQLFAIPRVLAMVSVVLILFAVTPGLPFVPFSILSVLTAGIAYVLYEDEKNQEIQFVAETQAQEFEEPVEEVKSPTEQIIESARVEPLEIEIGLGLISLANENNGKELFERILTIRKQVAVEMGLIIKPIRLKDSIYLEQNTYQINIKGNKVAEGIIIPDKFLVMNPNGDEIAIDGVSVVEPVFNLEARWIEGPRKLEAEMLGYTVIDDVTVLITHIKEVIKQYASDLLSNQEVNMVIESLKEENDILVSELIPNVMSVSEVTRILKNLLKEYVPINDIATILETLLEYSPSTKDVEMLTEYVRAALSRTICKSHLSQNNALDVITLHPEIEKMVADNSQRSFLGTFSMLDPQVNNILLNSLNDILERSHLQQRYPVIVTSPKIRHIFRKLIEIPFPRTQVLSLNEIPNDVHIDVLGMVRIDGN